MVVVIVGRIYLLLRWCAFALSYVYTSHTVLTTTTELSISISALHLPACAKVGRGVIADKKQLYVPGHQTVKSTSRTCVCKPGHAPRRRPNAGWGSVA